VVLPSEGRQSSAFSSARTSLDLIGDELQQAYLVSYRGMKMDSPPQEVNHEDEPSVVSADTLTFFGKQCNALRIGGGKFAWHCPTSGCVEQAPTAPKLGGPRVGGKRLEPLTSYAIHPVPDPREKTPHAPELCHHRVGPSQETCDMKDAG
jgi:hypothetical protein